MNLAFRTTNCFSLRASNNGDGSGWSANNSGRLCYFFRGNHRRRRNKDRRFHLLDNGSFLFLQEKKVDISIIRCPSETSKKHKLQGEAGF